MNDSELHLPQTANLSHFFYWNDEGLAAFKDSLGLFMNVDELRACQNYYRTAINREPRIDELRWLDSIVKSGRDKADTFLLAEMKTDLKEVAETFADLISHRHHVGLDTETPPSLAALAHVMERYLSENPRKNALDNIAVCCGEHRELSLACGGYLRSASTGNHASDIVLGSLSGRETLGHSIAEGDYIFSLLDSMENAPMMEKRLLEFLPHEAVRCHAKKVIPVTDGSLSAALIQAADSIRVRGEIFADSACTVFEQLSVPVFGALIVAAPSASADLLLLAQEMGLSLQHLGTVMPDKLGEGLFRTPYVAFHTDFLRTLVAKHPHSAPVNLDKNTPRSIRLSRIGTCTLKEKKHALVKAEATGENAFLAAVEGILYSLLHCFAAGAELLSVGLFCHWELPRPYDEKAMGDCLAALLGMYRMQAEFELFGNAPDLRMTDTEHPALSAVTVAPLPHFATPSMVTGTDSLIYYLEPLYTADGLPDFDDLKKMLSYLEKLNRDGHILSMLPTGTDLLAALGRMSGEAVVEYLRRDHIPSRIGGLLVETDIHIQGTLIAKTERKAPAPKPVEE